MMESWTHGTVKVNKINLHYVTQGTGPLVILLHGFPEFWYCWRHQIPVLAEKYTVVALDMRGYNTSDKPEGKKHYKYSIVAHDIREVIVKLGFRQASIIGHDWGGGVTWQFIREYPGYIDKAIILNCPPPQILTKHLFTNFAQLRKSWYMFFFQLPYFPERYLSKDPKATFTKMFKGWAHNKDAYTEADIDKYVEAFSHPGAWTAALNYYRAAFRMAFDFKWRDMRTSYTHTMVLWGEDDKALGIELTDDIPKYFLGKFEMRFIPDASHWVQNDAPQLVNQHIMDFLAKEN